MIQKNSVEIHDVWKKGTYVLKRTPDKNTKILWNNSISTKSFEAIKNVSSQEWKVH